MMSTTSSAKRPMLLQYPVVFLLCACLLLSVAKAHAWPPYGDGDDYEGDGDSDDSSSSSSNNNNYGYGPPWKHSSVIISSSSPPTPSPTTSSIIAGFGSGGYPYGGYGNGNSGNGNGNGNGYPPGGLGSGASTAFPPSSSPSSPSSPPLGVGSEPGTSGYTGFDYQSAMRLREVHGILAAVAMVGLLPLGAILVRVVPGRLTWLVHALTQAVGYVTFVAAAVLGLYLVSMVKAPNGSGDSLLRTNAHPILGLIVLILLSLQPALGLIHHARFKRLGRRTIWSHLHIWVGRFAVSLGIINGGLGLQLAGAGVPAIVAYAVVSAVVWVLWFLAAVWGEVRLRRLRKEGLQGANGGVGLRGGGGGAEEEAKVLGHDGGSERTAATTMVDANSSIIASHGGRGGDGSTVMATLGSGSSVSNNSDRGRDIRDIDMAAAGASSVQAHMHTHALAPHIHGHDPSTAAAAAGLAAPFFPPQRPETPSPPYTPGPAGATEWTIYGGPGLNNTPRGGGGGVGGVGGGFNRMSEVSPVSPLEPEEEKGQFEREH